MYKKILWISLLIWAFVVLGCASVLSPPNCDTTPVRSVQQRCENVIYPKNAMDPCEPVLDNWEVVETQRSTSGLALQFLINKQKNALRSHCLGVFHPNFGFPILFVYVENDSLCALKFDQKTHQYLWDYEILEPKVYAGVARLFDSVFPGIKIGPPKVRC